MWILCPGYQECRSTVPPVRDDLLPISTDNKKQQVAQDTEDKTGRMTACKAAFTVWWWEDMLETHTYITQTKAKVTKELPAAFSEVDQWSYLTDVQLGGREDWEDRAHLLVSLSPEVIDNFGKGYEEDPFFKQYYVDKILNP